MSNKKVISTLVHLINSGITLLMYHDVKSHPKLKEAKAYYEGETLCFKIDDKIYQLRLLETNHEVSQ